MMSKRINGDEFTMMIEKEFYRCIYDEIKFIEISQSSGGKLDWAMAISENERKRIESMIS